MLKEQGGKKYRGGTSTTNAKMIALFNRHGCQESGRFEDWVWRAEPEGKDRLFQIEEALQRRPITRPIPKQEILVFLHEIEEGTVTLVPQHEPQDVYAGNVLYVASNGWKIVVYNDCNEWDYIDSIETPDGREIDYDWIFKDQELDSYQPSEDLWWTRYRMPGYCKFRCTKCGEYIKPKTDSYLCAQCAAADR